MPLIFRNNSGLGEEFADHAALISSLASAFSSAGWTQSVSGSVLTVSSNTEPYFFRFDASVANTLQVRASLDAGFTAANTSSVLSCSTSSKKLWLLIDDALFILWLNDSTKGFFYGGIIDRESAADINAWVFGIFDAKNSSANSFFIAKSFQGTSNWIAAQKSNLDDAMFSGTVSPFTTKISGFVFPIREGDYNHRGNLRYVLSGCSGATPLRQLSCTTTDIAACLNPDPDVAPNKLVTAAQLASTYPKWSRYAGTYVVAGPSGFGAAFKISN